MRKLFSAVAVFGLSSLLLGCPADGGKTGAKTGETKTGDAPKTGEATDGGEKTGETDGGETDGGDEGGEPAIKGVDISHVKKGQVYVYETATEMAGNTTKSTMKYKVTDVMDGKLKYQMIVMAGDKEMPQAEAEWPPAAAEPTGDAPKTDAPEAKTSTESVEMAGESWECMVTETEANGMKSKSWVPQKNGTHTWPMYVKSVSEGNNMKTTTTLVKIEGP